MPLPTRDYPTREQLGAAIAEFLAASEVPHHLRGGLVLWFSDGILPGGFLQAVLANDLRTAVAKTATTGLYAIEPVVRFLNEHAPDAAWGSRDALIAWTSTPDRLEV